MGRFAFHVSIAAGIACDAQLKRLQSFVDAIAGGQVFWFRAGLDLPPFARDTQSPIFCLMIFHSSFTSNKMGIAKAIELSSEHFCDDKNHKGSEETAAHEQIQNRISDGSEGKRC
jgi:hypothetical protein